MDAAGPSGLPVLAVRAPAHDERPSVHRQRLGPLRLAGLAFLAVAFHVLVAGGVIYFEQYRGSQQTAAEETPVEVVEEIPKEEPKPPEPAPEPTNENQSQSAAAQPPPGSPEPVSSQKAPLADEAADKPSPPQSKPQEPEKPVQPTPSPQPQAPPEQGARKPDTGPAVPAPPEQAQAGEADGPRELAPPPAAPDPPTPSEHDAATADYPLVPPTFRSAALPGADRATEDNYKNLVFGLLERAKRIPASAQARGAQGAALLSFQLDRAGNLVTVSLVRSTGDRELDAEAVALVRRASPFPKPPVGVLLTFTPIIYFGGS